MPKRHTTVAQVVEAVRQIAVQHIPAKGDEYMGVPPDHRVDPRIQTIIDGITALGDRVKALENRVRQLEIGHSAT